MRRAPPRCRARAAESRCSCRPPRWRSIRSRNRRASISARRSASATDLALVLGGDGSILTALRAYAGRGVPVFGFNFGAIGFLATLEPHRIDEALAIAFEGRFELLELPGIAVAVDGDEHWGVNDVSVHRRPARRVAELGYSIKDDTLGAVRCDGLVASTPVGSTGYNLANGGPILAWGVEGYVVSFIAPHTLTARTLVVAPNDVLTIENLSRGEDVEVTTDGRPACALAPGEHLTRPLRARQVPARPAPGRVLLPPLPGEVRPTRLLASSAMLVELRVQNLLLIESAELRLGPGLNVITGETGAGKTVLAHALDLLLGGKPRSGHRPPGRGGGVRRGRVRGGRRGDRARAPRLGIGPLARLPGREDGHHRRPARARQAVRRLLRPARAPQADGGVGPARGARRLLRRGAAREASGVRGRARARARAARRAGRAPRPRGQPRARPRPARLRDRRDRGARARRGGEGGAARRPRPAAAPRGPARRERRRRRGARAGDGRAGRSRRCSRRRSGSRPTVAGVDAKLDGLAERLQGAAGRGRGPGRRAAPLRARAWRPSRAGSSRSRSGSRRTTGSSASTAAASPRCSSTSSAAAPSASGSRTPRCRSRAPSARSRRRRRWRPRSRARCRRRGARRRRRWPSASARSWRSWRWRTRRSRSSCASARSSRRPAPSRSSS